MAKADIDIVKELRARLRTPPFEGLILNTSDGESFRVVHQDYVYVSPGGTTVHVYDEHDNPYILNARQIASITPLRPKVRDPQFNPATPSPGAPPTV